MQAVLKRLFSRSRKQRVYIVPTRFGFLLALFLIVMLLGAINYSNSMAHLLVFLLVSLAHTAMLHTHRNIAKVELKYCTAEPVFAGQAAQFHIVLNNPSQRDFHQLNLAVRDETIPHRKLFQFFRGYQHKQSLGQVPAQQSGTAIVPIDTSKRGYQALGRLRVSTQFPLGLFDSWTLFKNNAQVLVYPKPAGNLSLPTSHGQGEHFHTSHQAGLDDFAGFNPYRDGEPAHHIAWKSLAKDDVLRTKQFSAAQSDRCTLRWQDTQGDSETRLSQLCKWLLDAEQAGTATRLELPNQTLDFGAGDQHLTTCLTALACYDA